MLKGYTDRESFGILVLNLNLDDRLSEMSIGLDLDWTGPGL